MLDKFLSYYSKNFVSVNLKALLLIISFALFLNRAWVGEDAFIFFRYVDNFVQGNGLVFNVGERVEGFTSPLWVFVLSFFRFTFGWELRHQAIALGLLFGMVTIFLLLYYDNKNKIFFPVGVLLLITNSAFRDFITSGFETSLTLLLLTITALFIKYQWFKDKPLLMGLVVSLLVLARPETFVVFLFMLVLYFYRVLVHKKYKDMLLFIIFPVLLTGGYQIFRMGYYASLLPNTYYAKRGGELYISQGFNYLRDFALSYPLTIVLLLVIGAVTILNTRWKFFKDEVFSGRVSLIFISGLLAAYVLTSGGDFMHGRSILMAFTLLVIALNDVLELALQKFSNVFRWEILLILMVFIGKFSSQQLPITAVVHKQINHINDERLHFGFDKVPKGGFKEYLAKTITGQFNWKNRGIYYKDIAEAIDMRILIYMPNIGFFGYASEDLVSVMGTSLIDPPQARLPLKVRGKIGHEDEARWDYLFSRRPTFSYTPFKQWNASAQFRYEESGEAPWIKGDSDDSFIPVFDLSNKLFLERYSELVGADIKASIDLGQRQYLRSLTMADISENREAIIEYFGFLKYYWLPYASDSDKAVYEARKLSLFGSEEIVSSYEVYYETIWEDINNTWERITEPLTIESFLENVLFSVRH